MMYKNYLLWLLCALWWQEVAAQSVEIMGGNQRLFVDVQWLKPLDTNYRGSIFSRTRATLDYEGNSNVFLGLYGNYTSKIGLGASLVGRISSSGNGADVGIHLFKQNKDWLLFALASAGFNTEGALEYSWFSITRFTPVIKGDWKAYISLELFSLFRAQGHFYSTQRLRLGISWKGWQIGVANNFAQLGDSFVLDNNLGGFIRKEF